MSRYIEICLMKQYYKNIKYNKTLDNFLILSKFHTFLISLLLSYMTKKSLWLTAKQLWKSVKISWNHSSFIKADNCRVLCSGFVGIPICQVYSTYYVMPWFDELFEIGQVINIKCGISSGSLCFDNFFLLFSSKIL